MSRLLAADVGGTKTDLALYETDASGGLRVVRETILASASFTRFAEVAREFVKGDTVDAAAFGIPGPVIDDRVITTNLPWRIEGDELRTALGTNRVRLMNDLETTALGALHLPAEQFRVLNPGKPRQGTIAVIAAGTGLGQAYLFWDGTKHLPAGTEGGHVDFAPRDEREWELLRHLRKKFGRVSIERVVSGPGLWNIFEFLTDEKKMPVDAAVAEALRAGADRSAVVGKAGVDGSCATCVEAVETMIRLYGAQAGNLALTVMATGGVFIGGGIIGKLLPRVTGGFMQAFRAKGRYESFMDDLPVKVILDPRASRLGAAIAARALL